MIILILGPESARGEARARVLEGKPSREMLYGEESAPHALLHKAQTESLFADTSVYGIVGAAQVEEWVSGIKEILPALSTSSHVFIFEEDAGAPFGKLIEKAKGEVIKVKAEKKIERTDAFALAGALASRDKKKLWLMYTEAIRDGASPEALAGMLAWKARSMLASEKKGRVPAGFGAGESEKLSGNLVRIYHDAHRGEGSLELLLERFILSL